MLRFDEGDRAFDLLTVLGPAGLLQLLGEGRQLMCAEGGARRFEGVVQHRRMVSYSCPCLLQAAGGVSGRLGIPGFDHASESATSSKLPRDFCVHRPAGLHGIVQNTIDRVFIKDAKIAVCVEVHF